MINFEIFVRLLKTLTRYLKWCKNFCGKIDFSLMEYFGMIVIEIGWKQTKTGMGKHNMEREAIDCFCCSRVEYLII